MKSSAFLWLGLVGACAAGGFAADVSVSTASVTAVATSSAAPVVMSSGMPEVEVSTQPDAQAPGTVLLSLPQCVQTAITQATLVLKAKNDVDFTGTQLMQAYMQFLPNLEASAGYTYETGRTYYTQAGPTFVTGTRHGGTYELASTLNLFNGLSDLGGFRSSSGRKAAADLSLYRAKQQIAFDVTQAYLQVLLDRQIVGINESNLQASRQREQLLNAQAQVGARSLADLYRQQAQTSADELSLITSRVRAKDDLLSLLQRLHVDLLTPYDIAEVILDTRPAVYPYAQDNTLVMQALQQRADLEAQEQLARATRWDVTSARSGYFPQINLVGDLAGTGSILDRQEVNGVNTVPASSPHSFINGGIRFFMTSA